ncbi:MAG: hypothetical protein IPH59_03995 [bacterium]|nr:hypothetical protein [bacterium]
MRLITILTDIGGPVALHNILSELPRDFGTPILVIQPAGQVLAESATAALRHTTELRISKIHDGEELKAGSVYFVESGQSYMPDSDRSLLKLVSASKDGHSQASNMLSALARLLGSEMTVVFLSGRGDSKVIKHVCSALEQCGCRVLVLDKKESVVDELGRCALKFAPSAHEMTGAKIVATISAGTSILPTQRNATKSTSE